MADWLWRAELRRWLLLALVCVGCAKHVEPDVAARAPRSLGPAQPFGNHRFEYATGVARPSHASAAPLDDATARAYDTWKARYLVPGCGDGEYHVRTDLPGSVSLSQATGYGMLVTSLLAGHDPRAKQFFDGLFRYFLAHQSALTPGLMAWHQGEGCRTSAGNNSATEGDLDVAYALLLADRQWGSCGTLDYAARARWVIDAIASADMHREGRYMLLGDWVAPSDRNNYDTTRSADFMPSHFRGFQHFMQQAWWVQVVDNGYWLIDRVQLTHAGPTGLLPSLIEAADSDEPRPAAPGAQGDEHAGSFGAPAARALLRIGTDYLAYGDLRAKRILDRVTKFVEAETRGEPSRIAPGYSLSGEPLPGPASMSFTGPLGVAAMSDPAHQKWLDRLWSRIETAAPEGYAADSVRLLSMLVMSGNWWVPDRLRDPCASR